MNLDKYSLEPSENNICFYFTSIGRKGRVKKLIKFQPLSKVDYFNLSFGDIINIDEVDDMNITDNGDSQKVLATVANAVLNFTDINRKARIVIVASSAARTRLYRIGISNNLFEINKQFILLGLLNNNWEVFEPGKDYKAFLAKRK
jgi:hypothetical protein